ncbi:MAG: organic hydroperoxide resistance protein [Rubrobacteraceae bacterium]
MDVLYTATATAKGDRRGRVESSDGVIDMDLSMPEGLGGPGGSGTNPEQLFAAAYAACFESALNLVAREEKADVSGASITARVHIGHPSDGGFGLAAEIIGNLPNQSKEEAEELMEKAHGVCPYSRATKGSMDVKLSVEG